jgi:hypothetical protein
MTPVTMFCGASGPLNGTGLGCGVTSAVGLAANVFGDDVVVGAARLKV